MMYKKYLHSATLILTIMFYGVYTGDANSSASKNGINYEHITDSGYNLLKILEKIEKDKETVQLTKKEPVTTEEIFTPVEISSIATIEQKLKEAGIEKRDISEVIQQAQLAEETPSRYNDTNNSENSEEVAPKRSASDYIKSLGGNKAIGNNNISNFSRYDSNSLSAVLVPRTESKLASEINGNILKVNVKEGSYFEKGDILLEFDCEIYKTQLAKATAEYSAVNATYLAKRKLLDLKTVSALDVKLAKAELDRALAEINSKKAIIKRCTIHAPFSGSVVEMYVNPHESIRDSEPIMRIVDAGEPFVEMLVPSNKIAGIRINDKIIFKSDETGRQYRATVKYKVQRIEPVSQMFKVIGQLDNPTEELISGMTGTIDFIK